MAVALGALLALGALSVGLDRLESVPTGPYSERVALAEGRALAEDRSRFGIVERTHYPNGPTYVVAALTRLGVEEPRTLRLFPLAVSSLAVGLLGLVLLTRATTPLLQAWVAAALGGLVLQPGFASWQGALHEHSYAVSMALVAAAVPLALRPSQAWVLVPLGFAAGWIGYDWLPGQALVVATARWLDATSAPGADLRRAAGVAVWDALRFTSGATLAVLAHAVQLVLYHGGVEAALRDLLGAAAVRMGAPGSVGLSPEYHRIHAEALARHFGARYATEHPDPLAMLGIHWARFLLVWADPRVLAGLAAGAAASTALALRRRAAAGMLGRGEGCRRGVVLAVAAAGAVVAACVWTFLMPHHAVLHRHILDRHFLLALPLLVAIPALQGPPRDPAEPLPPLRSLARSMALHAAAPSAFLVLFAGVLVAFR